MNSISRSWHGIDSRSMAVLAGVVVFGTTGDACLARGMHGTEISVHNLPSLFSMLWNPWVILGTVLLAAFFATWTWALSFTDLSFLLPATSGIGFVFVALAAKFLLHENVSVSRWCGIGLIALGVGFVAAGPANTTASASGGDSGPQSPEGSAR